MYAAYPAANDMEESMENNNVIVVTSGKGGVGKTTTSANVGTGLAKPFHIMGKQSKTLAISTPS